MATFFNRIISVIDNVLSDFVAIGAFLALRIIEPLVINFVNNFLPAGIAGGQLGRALIGSLTDVAKFAVWNQFAKPMAQV